MGVLGVDIAGVLGILFLLVIWFGVAWLAGWAARRKDRSFAVWAVAAIILGPGFGVILTLVALALPRSKKPKAEHGAPET
jgi:hypothetical protein